MARKISHRLYVNMPISIGQTILATEKQKNYLHNVLRLNQHDILSIFNGIDGQFSAEITYISKKELHLTIQSKEEEFSTSSNLSIFFSPIKNPGTNFCIQKATELGVRSIYPIYTQYTALRSFNKEKMELVAIEAAEQSNRQDLPYIHEAQTFDSMIQELEAFDHVYFCDETAIESMRICKTHSSKDAIIIGPEGGFSELERKALKALKNVKSLSLGKLILRAETALIASIAIYNAN